jgi:hypothetical protein
MLLHHGLSGGSGGHSVQTIYASAVLLLVQQVLPSDFGWAGQIERLGLTGALIVAVGVLWRSQARKDEQLREITKQVAEALAFNTDTQKELRKIVEESTKAKQELGAAIEDLSRGLERFPCQAPNDWNRTERRGGAGGGD